MPYVGLIDISGIQRYLYRSSDLKDIAGASEEVETLSSDSGVFATAAGGADGVEIIFAAGGNAAFHGESADAVKAVIRRISRNLLTRYPELSAVAVVEEYERGKLAGAYPVAALRLDQRKKTQPRDAVTRFCGLAPGDAAHQAPSIRRDARGLCRPLDFDKQMLCQATGEQTNLMGVVSVDGLRMGKKLIGWLRDASNDGMPDDEFCRAFRHLSSSLKSRWQRAWDAAQGAIAAAFEDGAGELAMAHDSDRTIALRRTKAGVFYPMRRIYQGGDDLVFVCDARVALTATEALVAALENERADSAVPEPFRSIRASAGVVFVESHFPFFRAVQMADTVRKAAKARAENDGCAFSYIDWWVNRQGDLDRPADAASADRYGSMKPYKLGGTDTGSLRWLDGRVLAGLRERYAGSRNKLKDLSAALDEGPDAVRRLLTLRPLEPSRGGKAPFEFCGPGFDKAAGQSADGSPLRDAVEVYDICYSLPGKEDGQ